MTKPSQCDRCGSPFTASKPWQRFCSTRCRVNDHQSGRYADSKKAAAALTNSVRDLRGVARFLETVGPEGAASLAAVQRIIKRAANV